jgi:diguanylate cyclase (GGDEF)-like protein
VSFCNISHVKKWLFAGLLGWVGLLVGALAQSPDNGSSAARPAELRAAAPPPLQLNDPHASLTLDGRSLWWIDTSGRRTMAEVEASSDQLPWAIRQGGRQYNLDDKALWVRFDAVSTRDSRWYLELGSSGIDRAQLFYRDPAGQLVTQEAGDTRPVSGWPLPGRVPTFELSPQMHQPVRYWLRVEHRQVDFAAPMRIAGQAALLADREREQFLLGAYFGLAVLIAVVAAANAIAFRDRSFGAYAIYVGALGVGQAAYLGVGAQHLWDPWLEWNSISPLLLPGLSGAAALWFVKVVTEPARFARWLDHVVWGVIAALLMSVAADTAISSRLSLSVMIALMGVALGTVVILVVLVWLRGNDPHMRLIALGFLPVLLMAVFPVARGLNLIPHSPLTRYGVAIGAALEMPILFYALSLRGSRRRESQLRAAALAHNDALTGLSHSQSLRQRLSEALERARSQRYQCALLGVAIANVDAIEAEFGRDALDRVLVMSASYLRRAITDVDMAARVGNYEFVLLLVGPTTAANAISRAQQVVASGLRQTDALPPGLIVKFNIAAALLPHQDIDAHNAVRWVVDAAKAITADARKLIRPLNF